MKAPRQEPTFTGDRKTLGEVAHDLNEQYPRPVARPLDYAPAHVRNSEADLAQAAHRTPPAEPHSFLELPMKELEETRKAARDEMAFLDNEANELYQMFESRVANIKAKYERLRKGIGFSMDAFKVLREQCVALDDPPDEETPPAER